MSRFALLFVFCVVPAFLTESDSSGTDRSLPSASPRQEFNPGGSAPHAPPAPTMEPGWNFKSPLARDAKKKYDAAITAAETSYSLAKSNARKALTEDLQAAMKEATRAADLEEAVKLQAAIESVKLSEAAARPQRPPCLPVGKWRIEFANGVVESCEIRTDGSVVVVEPQRTAEGKTTAQDGSFLIACHDDRIERWTPVGRRMVVEHWFPIARFPGAMAVPGIAERLPAERTAAEKTQTPVPVGQAPDGWKQEESEKAIDDLKLLQGTWSAVALQENGREIPKEELDRQNLILTVEGNTFRLRVGTGAYQGTIRIDPRTNPKMIDFIWKRFGGQHILPEQTLIAHGIYELKGETLKIRHGLRTRAAVPAGTSGVFSVWGTTRPKDFKSPGAWQTTTYTRLRKKPTLPAPTLHHWLRTL